MILRVLQHEKTLHIEKLVEKSGLNAGKLAYLLLEMEFKKVVLCKPGKLYELA
jgi:predicted Rossmann fold nucleotide-binding protein DprA/Smf involved in DNA uptake